MSGAHYLLPKVDWCCVNKLACGSDAHLMARAKHETCFGHVQAFKSVLGTECDDRLLQKTC